ncbi:hypothetical protein Ctob_012183 [Chrysochromulina tobinii]|uniref:ribonuclease P n=1 Tax=Chrysochromulina tobinii TaxID=1460289 RepID=A0A0M0JXI8_9EUKA|nr:hypothetical protein Ctob_012183 [Chrysochromulina tobinii]|eukprot:KOO31381.1 hypothetical protein Ctob_012183 [Chrysochromulina sp. CCMP291]
MSLPSTADASAVNETLWPPRDKQARRLWHELQRFKKQQMGGAKSHILDLPPQSSYLRACTHHYAKLLGLATETQASGNGRAVRPLLAEALEVFVAAQKQAAPAEPMWSGIIKLHCAAGDPTAGLARIEEMIAAGVAPRLRSFSPIISAACEARDHELAERCLAPSHVERVLESFREYGPQARWVAVPCATDARGECSYSGVTLAPALIDEAERAELRRLIPQLVGARIKATEFAKFAQWIERELVRAGPFDYVLDGANIGFFGCSKVEKARRLAKAASAVVVSNDEMRDHTFGLMDSRVFAKWRERHVVHFDIPGGTTAAAAGLKPALLPPLPYSHVMQEHPSGCWHVPCAEQHPNGWVCVQRREDLL